MEDADQTRVTALLRAFRPGAPAEELIEAVYPELRRVAARVLATEQESLTLSPTALVHEAWLRLVDQRQVDWQGRTHFFSLSARLMRRILVDHARQRLAHKRGAGSARVTLGDRLFVDGARLEDIVAVSEALDQLHELDARQADLVELRFFGGLSIEEAAAALGIAAPTAKRDWNFSKAWLRRRLTSG